MDGWWHWSIVQPNLWTRMVKTVQIHVFNPLLWLYGWFLLCFGQSVLFDVNILNLGFIFISQLLRFWIDKTSWKLLTIVKNMSCIKNKFIIIQNGCRWSYFWSLKIELSFASLKLLSFLVYRQMAGYSCTIWLIFVLRNEL